MTIHTMASPTEALAQHISTRLWEQTQLPASIGIGTDKTVAKYAVNTKNPRYNHYMSEQTAKKIGPLPVTELCGKAWYKCFLKRYGAHSCADVAKLPTCKS